MAADFGLEKSIRYPMMIRMGANINHVAHFVKTVIKGYYYYILRNALISQQLFFKLCNDYHKELLDCIMGMYIIVNIC